MPPADTIMHYRNYADEEVAALSSPSHYNYGEYINHYYRRYHGEDLPTNPEVGSPENLHQSVQARVNVGRWICDCPVCGSAILLDPDIEAIICPPCAYYGWMRVEWPKEKAGIETELLKHPGQHRLDSPIREWKPGWTVADLEARTALAEGKHEEGKQLRKLSIGATKSWVDGEILRQTDLLTYVNGPINDNAGRNGVTDHEDSLTVLDGSDGDRYIGLPGGTTAQRPTSPGAGAVRWNTDDEAVDAFGTAWAQLLTAGTVTYANLNTNGDVGTAADNVSAGNHTHQVSGALSISYSDLYAYGSLTDDWSTLATWTLSSGQDSRLFVVTVGSTNPHGTLNVYHFHARYRVQVNGTTILTTSTLVAAFAGRDSDISEGIGDMSSGDNTVTLQGNRVERPDTLGTGGTHSVSIRAFRSRAE